MSKKLIRTSVLWIALVATSICASASAVEEGYQIENQSQVMEEAAKLNPKGVLKQEEDGTVYLEVSKEFITKIIPLINVPGKIVPPRGCQGKKKGRAQIKVIHESELVKHEIWEIREVGQEYTFKVVSLRTVKLHKDRKVRKLWLLVVDAPELEQLRAKYGLKPLPRGRDFHILIGKQVPGEKPVAKMTFAIEDDEEFDTEEAF